MEQVSDVQQSIETETFNIGIRDLAHSRSLSFVKDFLLLIQSEKILFLLIIKFDCEINLNLITLLMLYF